MLRRKTESLPSRLMGHLPSAVVPDRYQRPERSRAATVAWMAAGALAVGAAGAAVWQRLRTGAGQEEAATIEWSASDLASQQPTGESRDGTGPAMAAPAEPSREMPGH